MTTRKLITDVFDFNGAAKQDRWSTVVTGAAPPTGAHGDGCLELALTTDVQIQNVCVAMGDKLPYDIDDLEQVDIWAKCTASLAAVCQASFGMASARNDTIDSLTNHASFRLIGSNAVYCESDDNTNDVDDISAGDTLVAAYKHFRINFKEGLLTVGPPANRVGGAGGKANVLFSMENAQGQLRPVCQSQRFNMENCSTGLQPYFQLQKTSNAAGGTLSIRRVEISYRL